MKTRRRFTFKRRSGGRRSASGLRTATAPRRWNTSDFFIDSNFNLQNGSAAEQMRAWTICNLADSLDSSDISAIQGISTVLQNIARKIAIGGIVYDWGFQPLGTVGGGGGFAINDGYFNFLTGLVVDKVDTESVNNDVIPAFVNQWSPWTSGFPTARVEDGGVPGPRTREVFRPMRILWRKADQFNVNAQEINPLAEALYVPANQRVDLTRGTVNRRLKLLLNDDQGLYLFLGTRNSPAFDVDANSRAFRFWAQGQLYWRFIT